MQIQIRQIAPSTSEAEIRGHRILMTGRPIKEARIQGPMGGELFLASIGGAS